MPCGAGEIVAGLGGAAAKPNHLGRGKYKSFSTLSSKACEIARAPYYKKNSQLTEKQGTEPPKQRREL
jgi:hypothetical protein